MIPRPLHPDRLLHAGEPDRLELVDRLLRSTGLADHLSFCASFPVPLLSAPDELRLRLRTGDRERDRDRDFDADRRDFRRLLFFLPLRSEAALPLSLSESESESDPLDDDELSLSLSLLSLLSLPLLSLLLLEELLEAERLQ